MDQQLSGRELDKQIAIKLFGAENVIESGLNHELRRSIPEDERGYPHGNSKEIPVYHADANATLVVCSERGWRLSFGRNLKKDQPYAAIEWDDDDWDFVTVNAATPQEAAARALLAALRHVGT